MTSPFKKRVVRIGTHSVSAGSKTSLWNRLRTHRGASSGLGNHRGSIFRLHVGECLIAKYNLQGCFPNWGKGQSASSEIREVEQEIELEVSDFIGKMHIVWVPVNDDASPDSDRSFIERNLIAMLSGPEGPLDQPSGDWLGRWSSRQAVRESGLWNVNYVTDSYDPIVLEVLEAYVEIAEGSRKRLTQSLAPPGWRKVNASNLIKSQINLI